MRQIILDVLKQVACKNTGSCQINLQSESAQIMIADKLVEQLDSFNRQLIEDIVCGIESDVK
tara:strand:- start:1615 stop:1800 length:186 start_codon:yes stop_codon:yes gene_type:complete